MEVILIHKPIGPMPLEMMPVGIEMGKKIVSKPTEFVPGGKLIAAYYARSLWMIVCIWDVPDIEALLPFTEQMKVQGWNTDVIPVDKPEVALAKLEKAAQALQAAMPKK